MRPPLNRPKYRRVLPPYEMRKGLRVIDVQTGFFVYTRDAVKTRGGWTSTDIGPLFDPRKNQFQR